MAQKTNLSNKINLSSHFGDCLVVNGQSLYFLSDVHLTGSSDAKIQTLEKFLEELLKSHEPYSLFVLGDLFDFWVSDHSFLTTEYASLLEKLKSIVRSGNGLFYFEGNHDLHLKNYWETVAGAKVFTGPVLLEADGKSIGVEHGDQMDPEDKGYILLRWFLRTPIMTWLTHALPGAVVAKIGRSASDKSRRYTDNTRNLRNKDFKKVIAQHIKKINRINRIDIHISGHIHESIDQDVTTAENNVRAINLGWWNEQPKVLLFRDAELKTVIL